MKKKLLAAIAAGMLLCGMLTAPVSAAETEIQMGDVNLDGVVDVADAQLILKDYVAVMCKLDGIFTEEQRKLGNVDGQTETSSRTGVVYVASVMDAQIVLQYYCWHLVKPEITLEQIVGKEVNIDEASKAFWAEYQAVYDEATGTYSYVKRS